MPTLLDMVDGLMKDAQQKRKTLHAKLLAIKEHVVNLAKLTGSVECAQDFFIYWIPVFDDYAFMMRVPSKRLRKIFSCEITPEGCLNVVTPAGKKKEDKVVDCTYMQSEHILKYLAELITQAYLEENIPYTYLTSKKDVV
jgi:hypothetical protein